MPSISTWNRQLSNTMQWRLKRISGQKYVVSSTHRDYLFGWWLLTKEFPLWQVRDNLIFFRADFIIAYDFQRSIYFRTVCNLSIWFKSNHSFFSSFVYITSLPWWPFDVWVLFTRQLTSRCFNLLFMSSVIIIRTEARFSQSVAFHSGGFWQL